MQAAAFPEVKEDGAFQPQIGIWYTVWWDDKAPYDEHWEEWTRYKPVLGDYASDDPDVIRKHMEWIKSAGIDYIVLDDTNSHFADNGNIAHNIEAIFDVVESMEEGTAPQICFAIGAGQYAAGSLEAHMAEVNLIYEDYAHRPSYYHWKGKPLLIDYTTTDWFYKWDDDRFTVRWATGSASEGVHVAPETGLWGWVFDQYVPSTEVFGVMPGWDTAHQGRSTVPIDRENGDYYIRMWTEAVKRNPEMIVISSFNDHAEETGIEAISPRNETAEPWVDAYGNETPDWYEQITKGYASLRSGFLEGYYYRVEGKRQLYQFMDGEMVKRKEQPAGKPVIVIPTQYFTGKPYKEKRENKNNKVVIDVFQSWVDDFKGLRDGWSYWTTLEDGQRAEGLMNGAEFKEITRHALSPMFEQLAEEKDRIERKGFKVHPAWLNVPGWAEGTVQLDLPQKNKLSLEYYPGKVNNASDGITSAIVVDGNELDVQWITGEAGWKEKVKIDLSAYAGKSIQLTFKVGWGKEMLGDDATTAFDSFLIGDPVIVTR
ncbi:hypothetical protein [Paenibacillus chungangensis]|uniref:Uncharacterized protein n=1 Tax=Paenibacillus chungangensis TaxID=696535 RepID=A0ABW3HL76_9BACL